MDAQRWRRISEIFHDALDRDAVERNVFVKAACGDDETLRAEVAAMLSGDTDSGFLAPAPMNVKAQLGAGHGDALIGKTLGAYEVRRLLGRGGMGSVYLAVRTKDYKQRVALKVLKRGMDTDEILRRFRTEIRVQAALSSHTNIAGVFDAGTTPDGLPYFVMEYVEGTRLDQSCDNRRLAINERLSLFRFVCDAVQFAHQHTVIHRDLKPSNILVTAAGVPKLIDFGIAKLARPELTADTVTPTRTDVRLLTPEYASPEQVRGDPVTTASDVYSLGVLLYELLAGHRPYRFGGDSMHSVAQAVCEVVPERPSAAAGRSETVRLSDGSTTDVTPETVAMHRRTQPKRLKRTLAGDLDNIVLKALRKDPRRRYATVGQLSEDIRRYLDGEPVDARPISSAERLARWCRRHPLPTGIVLALVTGLVIGVWHLSRLSESLVHSAAADGAAQQARVFERVHEFYSQEVERVEADVTDGKRLAAELTSPARFVMDLATYISEKERGESGGHSRMYARLYSRFPFQKTTGTPAPKPQMDKFERVAIDHIEQSPDEPYVAVEDYMGIPSLRYVQSRIMLESCVKCHNEHERSPKRDWHVGDVGGAVQIIRPLDNDMRRIRDGLASTFVLMAVASLSLLSVAVVAVVFSRRGRAHIDLV